MDARKSDGLACVNCQRWWELRGGKHRKRPHFLGLAARFTWHKLTNLRCKPWDWKSKGVIVIDPNPWLHTWTGSTLTITRNPTPWRRA